MSMRNATSKPMALIRHYSLQCHKFFTLCLEYIHGLISFATWMPKVARNYLSELLSNARQLRHNAETPAPIEDLETTFINLDARRDRLSQVQSELKKLPFARVTRFAAVKESNGSLGCAKSHIEVLKNFIQGDGELLMVCEDDVEFIGDAKQISLAIREFRDTQIIDVLCLSFRLRAPRLPVSSLISLGNGVQTTACYLVKRRAIHHLLNNFRESEKLLAGGADPRIASIDITWKSLQRETLTFGVPRKRLARQRESYSDIARKIKRYGP